MLMKYFGDHKFIFVANTKTASSSIEASHLADIAEVRFTHNTMGKHLPIGRIADRFDFVFDEFGLDEFFKFGVIREPVDWVVSWFNYRSRPELGDPSHRNHHNYVGDIGFAEFWETNHHRDFLAPQSHMFVSPDDPAIKVNYLIRFRHLADDLATVCTTLDRKPVKLPYRNRSWMGRISASDVDAALAEEIRDRFRADVELIESLASFNAAGIELFEARPRTPVSRVDRVRQPLREFIRDTPLERPTRALVHRVRLGGRS